MENPGNQEIVSPHDKLMKEVYKEIYTTNMKLLQCNADGISLFRHLARKHLDKKQLYDKCQETLELLIKERLLIEKDIEHDRQRLFPGSQARGNGIRFRMEQDKSEDRNTRNRDSDPAEALNDAFWTTQAGNDDFGGTDFSG